MTLMNEDQKLFLDTLMYSFSLRDTYTFQHSENVSAIATHIGKELDLSCRQIDILHHAGLIHDIGKIGLPLEILIKPGKISEEEYGLIKRHPILGYNILKRIPWDYPLAEICIQHHEKINGTGYPYQLKDKDILLEAKIITVADCVDAMSTHRPYRSSIGLDKTLEHLHDEAGVTFHKEACMIASQWLINQYRS